MNNPQKTRTVLDSKLQAVGKILSLSAKIAPQATAKLVAKMWFMPMMGKPEKHIADWQAQAQQHIPLSFGSDVSIFTDNFNLDAPLVLCVHGWRGRGFQFRRFIEPLVSAGYRVAVFDAPAHSGVSDLKKWTTFYEFIDAIHEIQQRAGPVDSMIAHSFGAPTTSFAINDEFQPRKLALLAGNFDLDYYFQSFCNHLGLNRSMRDKILHEAIKLADERIYEGAFQNIHIDNAPKELASIDAKFWYDPEDIEISTASLHEFAKMLGGKPVDQVEGVGHFEILKSPAVIQSVVDFVGIREF